MQPTTDNCLLWPGSRDLVQQHSSQGAWHLLLSIAQVYSMVLTVHGVQGGIGCLPDHLGEQQLMVSVVLLQHEHIVGTMGTSPTPAKNHSAQS